jgi:hypothetical protein
MIRPLLSASCRRNLEYSHASRPVGSSAVRENLEGAVPTPRFTDNTFRFSRVRSTIVGKAKPGPPSSTGRGHRSRNQSQRWSRRAVPDGPPGEITEYDLDHGGTCAANGHSR